MDTRFRVLLLLCFAFSRYYYRRRTSFLVSSLDAVFISSNRAMIRLLADLQHLPVHDDFLLFLLFLLMSSVRRQRPLLCWRWIYTNV
jgi:hypothetical protein